MNIDKKIKKAIIFAPFWGQLGHVGNNRVDRFIRWLSEDGYKVVIIRAGSVDGQKATLCGQEITVRDPLKLYRDVGSDGQQPISRRPSKLRRFVSMLVFNPDPSVVWAQVAAKHPEVCRIAQNATFILSSSPPESAHLGAWKLSRRLNIPHIVDMRDGWLDEPLKPLLRDSFFRRWQEGRMELRILRDAAVVQVTSTVWKKLLCERFPELDPKVQVLTNGYPQFVLNKNDSVSASKNEELLFIHAGRFLGSRLTQSPNLLLRPLLDAIDKVPSRGKIQLIGTLSEEELELISGFKPSFTDIGWSVDCPGVLPRQELLERLPQADGLLLLSASHAAIPSKLFEYIQTGKPILVVTEKNSATWQICKELPQATLIDLVDNDGCSANKFIEETISKSYKVDVPKTFSEAFLKELFLSNILFQCGTK